MTFANKAGWWASALLVTSSACFAQTAADLAKKPVVAPQPYRMADGHPNWTGFWVPVGGMLERDIGLGGTTPHPGAAAQGFAPFSGYPELKSPYKERLLAAQKDAAAGKVADPASRCLPQGMPRMMGMIYGMEFLQTPGQVTMTSEYQSASRRVWLNQKKHSPDDELDPTYIGESIGHWEGDTLVVDTVGIRDDIPLNNRSLPHSHRLHLVERFSETTPGILEDKVSVDDPDAFTATWSEDLKFRYRPDLHIREYECLENNRNVGTEGQAVFDH